MNAKTHICGKLFALVLMAPALVVQAADWPSIGADELQMTAEPKVPLADAIFLYRQVDRDDRGPTETVHERIKILTEAGKSYGNLQIEYDDEHESILDIEARTVQPDGRVVAFEGEVFDQALAKSRSVRHFAKALALPDVRVGSIIEYRFRRRIRAGYAYDSNWILTAPLFTKLARFSLQPAEGVGLVWSWPLGLPEGTARPVREGGRIRLQVHDVPAFVAEEFAPPEDILKYRVDFVYSSAAEFDKNPAEFWRRQIKHDYKLAAVFIDSKPAMRAALQSIVSPTDSLDTKARKIYDRVQRLRNLTFERFKTEEEYQRQDFKPRHDVEDVWKLGYGEMWQLNWLFLALAREAGIQAEPVKISTRDRFFMQREMMNKQQLNTDVVRVVIDGAERFVNPGVPFAPFGLLPWYETFSMGSSLDSSGGSWLVTPVPAPSQSRIERKADLTLAPDGSLAGRLTITYTGLEALNRRLLRIDSDDLRRKSFLEQEVRESVPSGVEVELIRQPDWNASTSMMVAEFSIKVPVWALGSGRRLLLPSSLFTGRESRAFGREVRVHPLYFQFPSQYNDYVNVRVPKPMAVGPLPAPQSRESGVLSFSRSAEAIDQGVSLRRQLSINAVLVPRDQYSEFRTFFQWVKGVDQEPLVITAGAPQ